MPHGGHSKSPNSSICAGAVAGPSTCAGSAPGTPRLATGAGAGDCEPEVDDGAGCCLPTAVVEDGTERVKYHALPSATPRTARMMMNGSIRFITSFKLRQPEWQPMSERCRDHHSIRAGPRKHVPDAASNRARYVRDCKCPRCYLASHSGSRRG